MRAVVNESGDVKMWSFFPTKEDFGHGLFIVHEPTRNVYDGRYIVCRRRPRARKVLTLGFIVEGTFAKKFATSLAMQMGVPVSMQPSGEQH